MRTSGEAIGDAEWSVVEQNVELTSGGEMSRRGFEDLHLLEAEDAEGEEEDSWVTLQAMGFNQALQLDEACPFLLEVPGRGGGVGGGWLGVGKGVRTVVQWFTLAPVW